MTLKTTFEAGPNVSDTRNGGVSFLDFAVILAKHKRLVLGWPISLSIIGLSISFLFPDIYTANTKIMPPPQTSSGANAVLAQLGGLGGGSMGMKTDLYIGMLKSRTVSDKLIERFNLKNYYEVKLASEARKVLDGKTNISGGKDGIISIEVDDRDPKRASDLANGYVEELFRLTKVLAVTEASQRRLFFERQLLQAKENLAQAEASAKSAFDRGGLASVDALGRTVIDVTARLRAQISIKEVQIGAMRSYAADNNPALKLAKQELVALQAELSKLEGNSKEHHERQDAKSSGSDNLRLLRDLKYYEAIYEMLAKQFELAKIDEAKDSSVVQVVDKAIEPDRKSKPKRFILAIITSFGGLLLGILSALLAETIERARSNPDRQERFAALRHHLVWRRSS